MIKYRKIPHRAAAQFDAGCNAHRYSACIIFLLILPEIGLNLLRPDFIRNQPALLRITLRSDSRER